MKTIITFLLGDGTFDGIWFGNYHLTEKGKFWWRKHLKEYIDKQEAELAELKRQLSYYADQNQNQ